MVSESGASRWYISFLVSGVILVNPILRSSCKLKAKSARIADEAPDADGYCPGLGFVTQPEPTFALRFMTVNVRVEKHKERANL
jgi:hypothetical protein